VILWAVLALLCLLILPNQAESSAVSFGFLPRKPLLEHRIHYVRDQSHEWTGTVQIFRWKGDWLEAKNRVRIELHSRYGDVEEWQKDTAPLYFLMSANLRFVWGYGDTVALYRDFRASANPITKLEGSANPMRGENRRGWISAVVYRDD
jgi:hypothetical protein